MAHIYPERVLASIDVGTTKICVLIAHQQEDGSLEILGFGRTPSDGLSRGVVVDAARTTRSIRRAVQEAELMAGFRIEQAVIGVSGAHISAANSHGVLPIAGGQITTRDVEHVLCAARAVPIAEGQQILHILPQYFTIDGGDKILDPVGMHGIRLEVQAHIILGGVASVQNVIKCCQAAGVTAYDVVLEQLASAEAVLSSDERTLGVALLDIGGGTSDFVVYQRGGIRYTKVLPVAGNHFTNDLAIGLRITIAEAERIKWEYGIASLDALIGDTRIEVDDVQGGKMRMVKQSDIVRILQPRAKELISFVDDEVMMQDLRNFISVGMVLTGGGSLLSGIDILAQRILHMPVRIGRPKAEFKLPPLLNHPAYATGYGLLMYELRKREQAELHRPKGMLITRVFDRMRSWVTDFF